VRTGPKVRLPSQHWLRVGASLAPSSCGPAPDRGQVSGLGISARVSCTIKAPGLTLRRRQTRGEKLDRQQASSNPATCPPLSRLPRPHEAPGPGNRACYAGRATIWIAVARPGERSEPGAHATEHEAKVARCRRSPRHSCACGSPSSPSADGDAAVRAPDRTSGQSSSCCPAASRKVHEPAQCTAFLRAEPLAAPRSPHAQGALPLRPGPRERRNESFGRACGPFRATDGALPWLK